MRRGATAPPRRDPALRPRDLRLGRLGLLLALGLPALGAAPPPAGAQEIGAPSPEAGPAEAGAEAAAAAPAGAAGTWLASVRVDHARGGDGDGGDDFGGRVDAEHLWRRPGGATVSAGAEAFSLSDVEWLAGRLGGTLPLSAATTLYGNAAAGPGRERGDDLTYLEARAGVFQRLGAGPHFAVLEDLYLEVGGAYGNLVKGTVSAGLGRGHQASLTYGRSTGGNLGLELASVRWDAELGGRRWLAGFSFGDSRPEVLRLFEVDRATRFEEVFAGVVLDAAGGQVTLVLAHQEVEDFRRASLTVAVRKPRREAAR